MGQSQTKQVSGELERLLLALRRELVEEEGETAAEEDILYVFMMDPDAHNDRLTAAEEVETDLSESPPPRSRSSKSTVMQICCGKCSRY